ncbi:MAG: cohesin domain-containing protein, partial [Saprospiraceae bacterium]
MKRNILQQAVFALAMLGHTALSAQYIVGGCETETGVLTVAQETFTVTAGGRFVNSGTVHFTGVNTLTNHGGLSEQVESGCTADYRNPCGNTPGASGANIFDNSVATTTINGDNPLRMYAATIDRNIQLDNEWQIIQTFTFTTGMVTTDRADLSHFLHFRGTSSVVGAATVKHVNGYAGWSGTGPFTLPVGDGMKYRPVGLEGNCSTVFKAAYFSGDPGLATLPAGAPFSTASKPAGVTVSQSGYWDINGASATPITLHFDADSDLDLIASSLSQLVILGWNGTAWVSLGQTGSTGTLAGSGTVTCAAVTPDSYGAYALGAQPDQVQLTLETPNVPVSCGDIITYRVRAAGIDGQLSALQFSLNWDNNKLEYLAHTFDSMLYAPGGEMPVTLALASNGITFAYSDFGPPFGLEFPAGEALLEIRFRAIGTGFLPVSIDEDPNNLIVQDFDFNDVAVGVSHQETVENTSECQLRLSLEAPAAAACGDTIEVAVRLNGLYR